MGVLLDSSVSIKAERLGLTETQMLEKTTEAVGETELGISSVALTEMIHGIYRAKDPSIRHRRELFINEILRDIRVFPYTEEVAHLAGRIGGEQASLGNTIPPVDLLIGATALSLGFSVLTANERHFRLIPGLDVIAF